MLLEVAFFIQLKSQNFSSVIRFIYFLYRRLVLKIKCLKLFDFMGGWGDKLYKYIKESLILQRCLKSAVQPDTRILATGTPDPINIYGGGGTTRGGGVTSPHPFQGYIINQSINPRGSNNPTTP